MHRPWQIWSAFAAALVVVAAGVGWLSFRALESDRAEAVARRQAAVEEDVRLALWRMDSQMAAFVAQESARSADAWQPYLLQRLPEAAPGSGKKPAATTCSVPSPLLVHPSPHVAVYFQRAADGTLTSPQVPTGELRKLAVPAVISSERLAACEQRLEQLCGSLDFDGLLAGLPTPEELPGDMALSSNFEFANNTNSPNFDNNLGQSLPNNSGQAAVPNNPGPIPQRGGRVVDLPEQQEQRQQALGANEFRRRSNYVQQSTLNTMAQAAGNGALNPLDLPDESFPATTMNPRVIGGELFLARTVSSRGKTWLQGCWIDWKTLRDSLLADISDLLPQAELRLVDGPLESEQSRMLAALPVRLDPGTFSASAIVGFSPVRQSLVVAWGAMLLAALAVAVLLRGVVALSERRADFVSAVTHELRTPLTTFRMYAEMLAEGMVPNETARRNYLDTLRVEADRLTHLVENVLAYARLERGGLGNRIQPVSGDELLKLAAGRLSERARGAGLALSVSADERITQATVLCDASAVEQILFNLVDNACKYARQADNKTLDMAARSVGDRLEVHVRDHGPGISGVQRRRLFQPFRKSADEAARTAPGVGLGLALSRRLARGMGGDLCFDETVTDGAAFVLTLPLQ
jgi:signal transduction histidine kinase